ncbi:nineteen complex-related protein 2-domain-containing protein [Calycina marina]|uniref:Nineteen complex-related protein 2-domain-containing protein n=1 Tax=Calycina marina TaxID=1763456 RepID=A0A9P7Z5X5_9HELO|nr:nineteen complex-related protein 2-domain-containing protein [Calycina marina]
MRSAFGSKRKARKIRVDDEDEGGANDTSVAEQSAKSNETTTSDDSGSKVSNKSSIGQSNSIIKKKKSATSRLSFGPGEIISGDAAEALEDDKAFMPKKSIGRRVVEKVPYKGEEERPTYSKDYLDKLKSSTPTSRAMVQPSYIPSEAEIREKKERRARLAHEEDFISLNDDGGLGSELSLLSRKKKTESRLVREDEDLGEGFDEFVEDGRISLGKKQERAAKRKMRKEMAELINQAEGSSEEDSDDSEVERKAAYEAAQTRAGMDGLHKPSADLGEASVQMPTKITPLPNIAESLENFMITLNDMEQDMTRRQKNLEDLDRERQEILAREIEVQKLLKQAGTRYSALRPDSNGTSNGNVQDVVDAHESSRPNPIADRGLESFGNTPTSRPAFQDVD